MTIQAKYKIVVIYKSPVPYYKLVTAVQHNAIASRYDIITDLIYLALTPQNEATVQNTLQLLGIERHNVAVFNSDGNDLALTYGIRKQAKELEKKAKESNSLEVVKH
jgi:hypothetical protein